MPRSLPVHNANMPAARAIRRLCVSRRFEAALISTLVGALLGSTLRPLHASPGPGGGRWAYIAPSSLVRRERLSSFDHLAIIGFVLEEDGTLKSPKLPPLKPSHSPEDGTTSQAVRFVPVVAFRSASAGHALLHSREARNRTLSELAGLASTFGGIQLDLEGPDRDEARMLGYFLSLIHSRLARQGGELSIALFPPNSPLPEATFHDLAYLAPHADSFVLMTYDLHRPSTDPGPVTDLAWATEAVSRALQHIRADRLWLGVPTYGYEWTRPGRHYRILTAPVLRSLLTSPGVRSHRDPSGCLYVESHVTGPDGTMVRQGWFPDGELRERFESLAVNRKLAGTALWRPEFDWDELPTRAKKRPQGGR